MALSSGTGSGSGDIANRWRELHGEHSWQGLLDPLDMDLRKSILSYGELEEATGGFNKETHSPHYGLCMYGYDDLLTKSGAGAAAARNYKVTKFLYATEANKLTWIGYVAAATDEGVAALGRRDVVVVWRGTMTGTELQEDMQFVPAFPWTELGLLESFHHPLALVHGGFLSLYTASGGGVVDDSTSSIKGSARDQALEEVKRLMHLYKDEEASITVVGHSLGSALAILNAVDLVGNRVNIQRLFKSCPVTAIVFACPHVGNQAFKDAFDSFKDLRALHIRNRIDHVPRLMKWLPDLGVTLQIDTSLSPYLKDPEKTAHNLQCYLHAVAGEVGKFKLVVDLDIALVNKDADALKDEYHVPASWWVAENKGMVKNDQGKWELRDFEHY